MSKGKRWSVMVSVCMAILLALGLVAAYFLMRSPMAV